MKSSLFKKTIALLLAVSIATCIAGCGSEDEGDDSGTLSNSDKIATNTNKNGTIEMPYDTESTFNPATCTNLYNLAVADLMFECLFDLDDDLNPVPLLCESYTTEDGIKYTFTIRSDVKFSDGSAFTAEDAVYSITQAKSSTNYVRRFSCIKGISATSSTTFDVTLHYANYSFPSLLNIKVMKNGTASAKAPTGTGPYYLSGDTLLPNSHYRDESKIFTDSIRLVDITTIDFTEAFENGDIDIVSIDPAEKIFKYVNIDYDTYYYNSTVLQYISFNFNSSITSNAALRTAISLCIDRDYIASSIMDGSIHASPLILNSQLCGYYDTAWEKGRGYNLEKAKELLEEAKIKDYNGDGLLEYPSGDSYRSFSLEFIVNKESPYKVAAAEYITESLRSLGFDIKLNILSWSEYLLALTNGDFDMYYAEVGIGTDYNFAPLLETDGTLNYGDLILTVYSNLVYDFLAAPDRESKLEAAEDLCKTIADNSPIIPIGYKTYAVMTHRNQIENLSPSISSIF